MNYSLRLRIFSLLVFLIISATSSAQKDWEPFSKVYNKGRITVVTFFAPWSSSSMSLLSKMDNLKYGKPADVDFDLIGVLVDPKPKLSKSVKDEVKYVSMPLCHDQGHMVSSYGYSSGSVGMVVILDKNGGRFHSDHAGNSTVANDVMAKLTELSRGGGKPIAVKAPSTDSAANCAAITAIVKAAESGNFSSLKNNLSLPEAQGIGKVTDGGYVVYLVTGLRSPDTEYNKSMMNKWSNKIKKCLPDFLAGEELITGVSELLNPRRYKLQELWLKKGNVEMKIIQQQALDRTNIMLVVSHVGP